MSTYDPTIYTGLSDTGLAYTGSTALEDDITVGSPTLLDSTYGNDWDLSSIDLGIPDTWPSLGAFGPTSADQVYQAVGSVSDSYGANDVYDPYSSQSLSGISSPPFASAGQSTPTPNSAPQSSILSSALSSLSKLGTSFASILGGTTANVYTSAVPASTIQAGRPVSTTAVATGTSTLMLVVVVGALALLLLKGKD